MVRLDEVISSVVFCCINEPALIISFTTWLLSKSLVRYVSSV